MTREWIFSLVAGFLFSLGLYISGMANPNKVFGFLRFWQDWDPSLLFVMIAALTVNIIGYRWALKRPAPLWTSKFHLPLTQLIDKKLVFGAILFGIGWGFSGICPGPAIVNLPRLDVAIMIFVASMLVGIFGYKAFSRQL